MANIKGEEIRGSVTKSIGGNITNRRFVKESGDDVVVCSSAGETHMGVLRATGNVTSASIPQQIVSAGIALVEAGAAVTLGFVTTDASGRCIDYVAGSHVCCSGRALNTATAAGEIVSVELNIVPDN